MGIPVINQLGGPLCLCVPAERGGLYRIFPIARDERDWRFILVIRWPRLLRHSGERMTQTQILGTGLALAGAGGVILQILQALGLGASVSWSMFGLILMAKAGYDPRVFGWESHGAQG